MDSLRSATLNHTQLNSTMTYDDTGNRTVCVCFSLSYYRSTICTAYCEPRQCACVFHRKHWKRIAMRNRS